MLEERPGMFHIISLGLVLSVLWLLLSGHFSSPLLLSLGVVSVIVVVFISHRMDVIDDEGHPIRLGWRIPIYMVWLVKEILVSSVAVARIILSPRMPIDPKMITVSASQKSELGHVIYANSITLTPGTITVGLEKGVLSVHALTKEASDGLLNGEMDRRITKMKGDG